MQNQTYSLKMSQDTNSSRPPAAIRLTPAAAASLPAASLLTLHSNYIYNIYMLN